MRIVIDLQFCQGAADPQALQLAQDLCATQAGHTFWIALSNRFPDSLEALRLAFAAQRICVFDLPAQAPRGAWSERAAQLVRAHAFASLGADGVFVPHGAGVTDEVANKVAGVFSGIVASQPDQHDAWVCVHGQAGESDPQAVLERLEAALKAKPVRPAKVRPRLAYVSPLPPEKSGIADYSAELVPELMRFYEVELIVAQDRVDDVRLADCPVRTLDWFEQNAHQFDRLLYHFGNSQAHQHMFEMIRRHPGVVVLHDFFLSGILDNLERDGTLAQGFLAAMYESHGYTGLLEHRKRGRNPAIWSYPLNKGVLDNATGVIVHSEFSRELAQHWYGPDAADDWRVVPLLRGKPAAAEGPGARSAARRRLGLDPQDFLVCSFGMLGATKQNDELLDAFLNSPLAANPHCKLVFVGQNEGGLYGAKLLKKIADSGLAGRIRISGFVSPAEYSDYLGAADCAVQLRVSTRGETSASVLDCLLYGVPLIVNAHGSTGALSAQLLIKLPDQFLLHELSDALARLHGDAELRASLAQRASAFMQAEHAPARAGQLLAEAIEQCAEHGRHSHYQRLLEALVRIPAPAEASSADLTELACAVAANQNQNPGGPRQLLVDVSAVVQSDLKTGIQRVVRSVLMALIAKPPAGYRIEPVFSTGANRSYHYARQFTLGFIDESGLALEDAPIEVRSGDIFLGLDLFTNGTSQNAALLQQMRAHGVKIYFVMYDLLPVLRPEVFPFGTEQHFGDFLRTVVRSADGLLCISRAVADELIGWIERTQVMRTGPLQIGYFHLGADIDASSPSFGLPDNAEQILSQVRARPSFLMVGTVEPRKGHAQALAAFELLWQKGVDVNLVIVGKQGWMVDKLVSAMQSHPEKQQRLFWLPGVSDEMLLKLYASSAALLAASEGEGFGLPLIEAAQHEVPIIARDLPVFREVAGEHAYYFEGRSDADLATCIGDWLALRELGKAPPSDGMPWLTWSDSALQVLNAVHSQQWYTQLPGK